MKGDAEAGTLTGQPGAPIEALQEAFRVLSGAGTLKEHSARFCAVVGKFFDGDEVRLLRRTTGSWEPLGGGREGGGGTSPAPRRGRRGSLGA